MIRYDLLIRYALLMMALIFLTYRTISVIHNYFSVYSCSKPLSQPSNRTIASENELWINVFVHGSFGTTFGFLSIPRVLDDKVSGTSYRQTNRRLRQDDFFFSEQPILERGLIRIFPSFDIRATKGKKYAAYPIIKAYDVIDEQVFPHRPEQYYYTFGWSGLISQNSRRYEAIRLYNALDKEISLLKAQGKNPKIRLIAHSHGGNLCLNLAAIQTILRLKSFNSEQKFSQDEDTDRSLRAMLDIIKGLPSKNNMPAKIEQKVFDYVPLSKDLVIDELILLGTPIQPETQGFCSFPIFKCVLNFYSGQDFIQRFDWVSTRRYFSDQRFVKENFDVNRDNKIDFGRIIQARLVVGRRWSKRPGIRNQKPQEQEQEQPSWWQRLFFGKKENLRISADPTHKELWFVSWQDQGIRDFFFSPLPMVILAPLFLRVLEPFKHLHDVDINISGGHDVVKVQVADYQQTIIRGEQKISRNLIDMIKIKLSDWKPADKTQKEEFNAVYKHVVE